ncbi:hypothetical protein AUP07_1346 [methanogenic archaeon mixed culture ISO4-G1]|nr:hypothetical protein AUP07_1346 [methanogenic archaeon mixed culture ISO4-G1]
MIGQMEGAGKLRKASPFAVAAVAVVLVFFVSYLALAGNGGQHMDLEGEWYLTEYAEGYYDDGEIVYDEYVKEDLKEFSVTFEEIGDGIYSMHQDDEEYVCVVNNGTMMTSGIDYYTSTSVLTEENGVITMAMILSDEVGVAIMKLERLDTGKGAQADLRSAPGEGNPSGLNEGDVFEAFIANQYTDEGIIDHLSENRALTVNRVESDIIFYNSHGDDISLDYAAVRISSNDWMAIADFGYGIVLIDMVHIEDGVIYTASYDNTGGDIELWQVCYGDASKAVKAPAKLSGKHYDGTFSAYGEMFGEILRTFEGELSISIDLIDPDTNVMEVTLYAPEGDSYMGAMIFPDASGYRFYMESVYENDGDMYWGYYIGTLSKDLKKITLLGTADNGSYSCMIFRNVLELAD